MGVLPRDRERVPGGVHHRTRTLRSCGGAAPPIFSAAATISTTILPMFAATLMETCLVALAGELAAFVLQARSLSAEIVESGCTSGVFKAGVLEPGGLT